VLLAVAAEHVTGMSFSDAPRKEVLDPVGASRIVQQGPGSLTPKPVGAPDRPARQPVQALRLRAGWLDLLHVVGVVLVRLRFDRERRPITRGLDVAVGGWERRRRRLARCHAAGRGRAWLGLERLERLGPYVAFGHTGGKTGYGSIVVVVPDRQAVVVVLVNEPEFIVESTVTALLAAAAGS